MLNIGGYGVATVAAVGSVSGAPTVRIDRRVRESKSEREEKASVLPWFPSWVLVTPSWAAG